jgi:uncharacterized membrane protein
MPFNFYDAIAAALWATTAMTGFLTLSLALGWSHLDFGRLLGGIFMPLGRGAAVLGLALHYLNGLVFGLIYAGVLGMVGMPAILWLGFVVGTGFGLYHWLLSMPLISVGRQLNQHIRTGEEPDPGIWGIKFGPAEAALRLLSHLVYGAVFGFSYVAIALLNGTAAGTAIAGNGIAIVLPLLPAIAVVYLYASSLPPEKVDRPYVFQSGQPSVNERRYRARLELRERYEKGEITWDEYQHLRRQYAAEP